MPPIHSRLPAPLVTHTSNIIRFDKFRGRGVAVIGAGQSALEAAALLAEFGLRRNFSYVKARSFGKLASQRLEASGASCDRRSQGLGRARKRGRRPVSRARCTERLRHGGHLPPAGGWWLRKRVENRVPVHAQTVIVDAFEREGQAILRFRTGKDSREHERTADNVIAGTGYDLSVDRLEYLDQSLRSAVARLERAPRLNAFEARRCPACTLSGRPQQ
jgi:cation diffusion facilitator CzcD-associated flavoprotein CzcO